MTGRMIRRQARRVAHIHGIVPGILFSASRLGEVTAARWQAWHEAEAAGATRAEIARAFGMDWSSVDYGIRKHRGEI